VSSLLSRLPPRSPLFPYTTLFRSGRANRARRRRVLGAHASPGRTPFPAAYPPTRKNTASVCSAQEIGASSGMVFSGLVTRSAPRSEEHTSELQSRENLVCRLLLEK